MTESKLPEISDKSIQNEKIRLRDFSRGQSTDGNFRSSEMKIKRMDIKSIKVAISNSPLSGEIQNQKKMSIGIRVYILTTNYTKQLLVWTTNAPL